MELKDGDYILSDGAAWFTVGKFSVRIHKTDDGIVADIYGIGREDESPITSCWCLDSEAEG